MPASSRNTIRPSRNRGARSNVEDERRTGNKDDWIEYDGDDFSGPRRGAAGVEMGVEQPVVSGGI